MDTPHFNGLRPHIIIAIVGEHFWYFRYFQSLFDCNRRRSLDADLVAREMSEPSWITR
jgi:hypothetical protein